MLKQPRFCFPKMQYYVALNKLTRFEKNNLVFWQNYCSTKYIGKAKMLNQKLPLALRQIDARPWLKQSYVLEGSYDKRFNRFAIRFKFAK